MSHDYKKIRQNLAFANKFLIAAVLIQLPFLLPVRQFLSPHQLQSLFNFMLVGSGLCGGFGFYLISRELELNGESVIEHRIGPMLKASLQFMFLLTFFVPLLNLVIIVWAYAKSRSAVRKLDKAREEALQEEKRKAAEAAQPPGPYEDEIFNPLRMRWMLAKYLKRPAMILRAIESHSSEELYLDPKGDTWCLAIPRGNDTRPTHLYRYKGKLLGEGDVEIQRPVR